MRDRNILAVLVKQSLRCVVVFFLLFLFNDSMFAITSSYRNFTAIIREWDYSFRNHIFKMHFAELIICNASWLFMPVAVWGSLLLLFVLSEAYFFSIVIAPFFFFSCYLHDVTMIRKEKNPIIFQKSAVLESFLVCSLADLQFAAFVG